jgi:hypothetical protein
MKNKCIKVFIKISKNDAEKIVFINNMWKPIENYQFKPVCQGNNYGKRSFLTLKGKCKYMWTIKIA